MSWRGSGNFRSSGGARSSGRSDGDGSVFSGGSAGGPPLAVLIGAAVAVGVICLIAVLVSGAVTGSAQQAAAPAAPTAAPAAPTAAPAAAAPAAGGAAVEIPTAPVGPAVASGSGAALAEESQGDTPLFVNTSVEAAANTVYSLTFKNTGVAVLHNWVLVDGGDDVATKVNDAATAQSAKARKAEAAVPPTDTPGLLVASQQVAPGTSAVITFTAPGPGSYTFFCSFPGHYAQGMKGVLVVK